jgi:hypothetical protein
VDVGKRRERRGHGDGLMVAAVVMESRVMHRETIEEIWV